jgi:hypothetical protein
LSDAISLPDADAVTVAEGNTTTGVIASPHRSGAVIPPRITMVG